VPSPLDALDLPFMRLALIEVGLLAVAGGLLGAWIVLRRLAFFTHAVGGVTFPGLVVGQAAGFRPQLAGLAVALGYAGGVRRTGGASGRTGDAATGLLLAGALALGVVLASDVFDSGSSVDTLLFGTLVGLENGDLLLSGAAAVLATVATVALGPSWLAAGFDPPGARALGTPVDLTDALLLGTVALAVVTALPAVGALLAAAVFVVPAATVRLAATSVPVLLVGSVALAAVEGAVGLYIAYWLDVAPGPAVAVLTASTYALAAVAGPARRRVAAIA
jgi:manganese/iron transport system permease protein